jgi:hypothetical protein
MLMEFLLVVIRLNANSKFHVFWLHPNSTAQNICMLTILVIGIMDLKFQKQDLEYIFRIRKH